MYAAVDPSNGRVAVAALVEQLAKLRDGFPEEELHRAKELAKGRMLLRLEDSRTVSGWLGGQEILTRKIISPADVVARIDTVTTDDMSRLARDLLLRDHLSLAVVGPYRSDKSFVALLDL